MGFFNKLFMSAYIWYASELIYKEEARLSSQAIDAIVAAKCLFVSDRLYYGIDKEDVQRILDDNKEIRRAAYIDNDYDCDNFAMATMGLFNQPALGRFAFGYALSATHAFNFFVDRDFTLWIVEPQSGEIFRGGLLYTTDKYVIERYFL